MPFTVMDSSINILKKDGLRARLGSFKRMDQEKENDYQ